MKETSEKFYKAWCWLLDTHFWALRNADIDVVKVHPKLKRIVDDDSKNTLTTLVEGARKQERENFVDLGFEELGKAEKEGYERGKVDGKRERDAELREKVTEWVADYGRHHTITKYMVDDFERFLDSLTPNDNQPKS